MSEPRDISPADAAALAALADGRLEPERRAQLEARLASEPALAAALARQRAAVTAIRAATAEVAAPASLRERIEAMTAEAARGAGQAAPGAGQAARGAPGAEAAGAAAGRRTGGVAAGALTRRRFTVPKLSLRGWIPAAGLAAAVAAVLVVLVLPGGGPGVEDALAAASRPPTAPAAADPAQPRLLVQQQDGVRFPNYLAKFGWRAVGTRTDSIGGRATRTVFYVHGGQRIAYTIVGGDALDRPGGTRATVGGVALTVFKPGAVTWERQGHTCVMSGTHVPRSTLLTLASWKGKGAVEF